MRKLTPLILLLTSALWGDWENSFNTFGDYIFEVTPTTTYYDIDITKISKTAIRSEQPTDTNLYDFLKDILKGKKIIEPTLVVEFGLSMPYNDSGKIILEPSFKAGYAISSQVNLSFKAETDRNLHLNSISADFKWENSNPNLGFSSPQLQLKPWSNLNFKYSTVFSMPSFTMKPGLKIILKDTTGVFSLDANPYLILVTDTHNFKFSPNLTLIPKIKSLRKNITFSTSIELETDVFTDSMSLKGKITPTVERKHIKKTEKDSICTALGVNMNIYYETYNASSLIPTLSPGFELNRSTEKSNFTFDLSCDVPTHSPLQVTPKLTLKMKL